MFNQALPRLSNDVLLCFTLQMQDRSGSHPWLIAMAGVHP
jgi:hypothetical protein